MWHSGAFGVVAYEMLTGKQAFSGETASDTLASVLKDEPEWNRVSHMRKCVICLKSGTAQESFAMKRWSSLQSMEKSGLCFSMLDP